jgi:ribokinase
LIRRAAARGVACLFNLAPALPVDPGLFPEIDLLIMNESEAAAIEADPLQLARRLRRGLVITRGAAGATALLADGTCLKVPALPVKPVDTTGAGDTFVGVLAAALDLGWSLEQGLWRASAAAALACLARGAQSAMPDAPAIDAAIRQLPSS